MIQTTNPEVKTHITHRLSRIEGQLRGVKKMVAEDRDCRDIVQQLIAIRAALQSASLNFVQDVAQDCLLDLKNQSNPEAQRELMADLIQMLGKFS